MARPLDFQSGIATAAANTCSIYIYFPPLLSGAWFGNRSHPLFLHSHQKTPVDAGGLRTDPSLGRTRRIDKLFGPRSVPCSPPPAVTSPGASAPGVGLTCALPRHALPRAPKSMRSGPVVSTQPCGAHATLLGAWLVALATGTLRAATSPSLNMRH